MWYKLRVPLLSFACGYSHFPAPFVEKTVISPLNDLGTLVKNHLAIFMRVCLWALYSVPLVYMSVFIPVPHCFDYYSFVIIFEMRKFETSSFVLLVQDLAIQGTLRFQMSFRMELFISVKKPTTLFFIYLCLLPFLSAVFCGFQCTDLSPPCLLYS